MSLPAFTAIDFETATWQPESICQVGLVRFENGEQVDSIDLLVRPPNNYYFDRNIEVHGIKPVDTENAQSFDYAWHQIKHHIIDQIVVAHNSSFDFRCLKHALAYYDEIQPEFVGQCTRKIFRRGLAFLSKKYHIPLNHHDALSDANACGQLYIIHQKREALPKTGNLFD